jgi:hypothetical protein
VAVIRVCILGRGVGPCSANPGNPSTPNLLDETCNEPLFSKSKVSTSEMSVFLSRSYLISPASSLVATEGEGVV